MSILKLFVDTFVSFLKRAVIISSVNMRRLAQFVRLASACVWLSLCVSRLVSRLCASVCVSRLASACVSRLVSRLCASVCVSRLASCLASVCICLRRASVCVSRLASASVCVCVHLVLRLCASCLASGSVCASASACVCVRLASVCVSRLSASCVLRLASVCPCECLRGLAHFMRRSSFKEFKRSSYYLSPCLLSYNVPMPKYPSHHLIYVFYHPMPIMPLY